MNYLYYGDNLDILRMYIREESIDLIYLDPPFKSNQNYNVLFKERNGTQSSAQIKAFEDTWHWDRKAEDTYIEIVEKLPKKIADLIKALRSFLGENDMMAYLVMMAIRLQELHRVLKPTGTIYLHCDPTASHYLKLLMDAVFSAKNFHNEVIWKRVYTVKGNVGQGSRYFAPNTDSLLFYSKTDNYSFNQPFNPYSQDYIDTFYRYTDSDGRRYRLISMIGPGGASKGNPYYEFLGVAKYWRYSREKMQELYDEGMIVQTRPGAVPQRKLYLDQGQGVAVQSLWDDIEALSASARERLGYPTQKPEALLERIIKASSNEGDIVLDPFCGCGTTVTVAEKLKREWVGIDITHLAISLMRNRLNDTFGNEIDYKVIGEPVDLRGAEELAEQDRYQFQWWALGLVGARPAKSEQKKGADEGIDGYIYFHDDPKKKETKEVIIQVKSGNTNVSDIRDLRGVVKREEAQIGVFITLREPTKPMKTEAVSSGYYKSPLGHNYPKIQILTVKELLEGKRISRPSEATGIDATFRKAEKHKKEGKQKEMF